MTAIYDDSRLTYDSLSVGYDGYGLVAVASDQPAPVGALTARLDARRALAGAQPAATGQLTRQHRFQVRRLDGTQPVSPALLTFRRLYSLYGDQPTGSGDLSWRSTLSHRWLDGIEPAGSAELTRTVFWHWWAVEGTQLAGLSELYLRRMFKRTLQGAQPPDSGQLTTHNVYKRTLTGHQPIVYVVRYEEPNVTYEQFGRYYETQDPASLFWDRHTYAALAGEQPAASGELAWVWTPYVWSQYETFVRQLPEGVAYVTPVETDDGDVRYDARVQVEQADGGVEIVYRVRAPRVAIKEREKPRP